jgi:ankyrin repeat protein
VVQQLIDAGANLNATGSDGDTALIFAIRKGNDAIVQRLIAAGANVKVFNKIRGMNALMVVVDYGYDGFVRRLITLYDDGNIIGDTAERFLVMRSPSFR